MASSPVVARWELSRRLAALRKDRGLDVKAITDHLGFTRNYWSAVENDRTLIAVDKLRLLFELFDLSKAEQDELFALHLEGRKRGWWAEHKVLTDETKKLCGLEAGASAIRAYEGNYIPGLLQTEAYARAVISADPAHSKLDIDQLVEIRLRRQLILTSQSPPLFTALVSEAALKQQYAGPRAQSRQLDYMAELVEKHEHVQVRIVPFACNPGIIAGSSTLLFLEFDRAPHLPILGWQESLRAFGSVSPDDLDFRRLEIAWSEGFSNRLGEKQSLQRLREIAAEIDAA